jgi:Domain of unknown function (DUF1127)
MTYFIRQSNMHGSAIAAAIAVEGAPRHRWQWRSILSGYLPKTSSADQAIARALGELRAMTDQELSDIGLGRSDLTTEGLQQAAKRRAMQQASLR